MARRKLNKSKSNSTAEFISVVSIALVLVVLGMVGWMSLSVSSVRASAKESIPVNVYFKSSTGDAEMKQVEKVLKLKEYVRQVNLITQEQAKEIMKEQMGDEDFLGPLDFNPFMACIEIYLKEQFIDPEKIDVIKKGLFTEYETYIQEVDYNKTLVQDINQDWTSVVIIALVFAGLLLLIAVLLIYNTIQLAVFSKRFIVKSMQLVGATSSFIRRPFLIGAVYRGLVSALIATLLLSIIYIGADTYFSMIVGAIPLIEYYYIVLGIVGAGIIISYFSTYFALREFLRADMDTLY